MSEIDELVSKCKHEWTTMDGHKGCKVTGPNGNSIFLPAAGCRLGTSLDISGVLGSYLSATPGDRSDTAYVLDLTCCDFYRDWRSRYHGFSVRPVSE